MLLRFFCPRVVPTLQKTEMKRSHLFVMSQPRWVQNGEAGPPCGPSGPQVYLHPEAAVCTSQQNEEGQVGRFWGWSRKWRALLLSVSLCRTWSPGHIRLPAACLPPEKVELMPLLPCCGAVDCSRPKNFCPPSRFPNFLR